MLAGSLKVCTAKPRYVATPNGKAIYLSEGILQSNGFTPASENRYRALLFWVANISSFVHLLRVTLS
ncbi:MAG: hypothetical protein HOE48_07510 [Candidatus Latescibacteria bacterium]|nr:hypothetical protein [Candidatus Latescibacterota bacterium]MBT5828934.1 hypothetical protein [Candidatus Latescibacterota bacterium]